MGLCAGQPPPWVTPRSLPAGLRFVSIEGLPAMMNFPPDMARPEHLDVNRLSNQALVHEFEREWGKLH